MFAPLSTHPYYQHTLSFNTPLLSTHPYYQLLLPQTLTIHFPLTPSLNHRTVCRLIRLTVATSALHRTHPALKHLTSCNNNNNNNSSSSSYGGGLDDDLHSIRSLATISTIATKATAATTTAATATATSWKRMNVVVGGLSSVIHNDRLGTWYVIWVSEGLIVKGQIGLG